MTLYDLINIIERTAKEEPTVKTIVPHDVTSLNKMRRVRYGVFAWQQTQHVADIEQGFIDYGFNLFYIDRLPQSEHADEKEEKGVRLDIQSTAITTLSDILRRLDATDGVDIHSTFTFHPFATRFASQCAGAWVGVTIRATIDTLCPIPEPSRTITAYKSGGGYILNFAATGSLGGAVFILNGEAEVGWFIASQSVEHAAEGFATAMGDHATDIVASGTMADGHIAFNSDLEDLHAVAGYMCERAEIIIAQTELFYDAEMTHPCAHDPAALYIVGEDLYRWSDETNAFELVNININII